MADLHLPRRAVGIALLLLVLVGFELFAIRSGRIPKNSDQAIVGLMARHILSGREHPVFFYGATYDGSVEPYFVAGVFAMLGPSFVSYRLAMAALLAAIVLGLFRLTAFAFGERAGVVALAYLCVPPFFLLYKSLTSDGAYDAFLLDGIAVLGLALAADRSLKRGRGSQLVCAFLGLAAGIGWWITPLTATLSLPAFLWVFASPRPRPKPAQTAAVGAGAILGAAPWWIWNAQNHWASLGAHELGVTRPAAFLANQAAVLWTSLPTLEGGILVSPERNHVRAIFPFSRPISLALLGALLLPTLLAFFRKDRRAVLFTMALLTVVVAAACSDRLIATEPRFLFAYYALAAPLVGFGVAGQTSLAARSALRYSVFGALLIVHEASIFANRDGPVVANDKEVTGSLALLQSSLERFGLRRVYANYWTAYRLSFESNERIIATPLTGDDVVRYPAFREEVDRAIRPGVVLLDERDECYGEFLRENALSYRRHMVGEFGVYSDLTPPALTSLRSGLGLPLPSSAYRVEWTLGPQPLSMIAGSLRSVGIGVENRGPCLWSPMIHLSYHWWPLEAGRSPVFDGRRASFSDFVRPGNRANTTIVLAAPEAPGRYRLEYDLVNENVAWFGSKGGRTASVAVRILPAPVGMER